MRTGYNYNPDGTDIFDEDWDNLIVLDACRYDEFVNRADPPGRREQRISKGSASVEWVRGNFGGKNLLDTVYVSANGWYAKIKDELHTDLFKYVFTERDMLDGLTSHPKTVTEEALNVAEKYPNKRLIVHYMQPHRPYLGPKGREMFDFRKPFVDMFTESDASLQDLRECYRENLDLVLEHAEPLAEMLHGKTVLTADHGELLGERMYPFPVRHYGHPQGVYLDPLVTIPLHFVPADSRKHIIEDEKEPDEHNYEEVKQNLKNLGYL